VREEQEQREALADAEPPLAQPLRRLGGELTSVVFIGDLHADAGCAEQWLRQTKLVDMESEPWAWAGPPDAALVFLGDYVDKGAESRQALELVRKLQTAFPDNVEAMLGAPPFPARSPPPPPTLSLPR